MLHKMKLTPQPFNAIKSDKKIIEVRLYDKKRRVINLGDEIEFTKEPNNEEKIKVQVIGLLRYKTFADLADDYPPQNFGAKSTEALATTLAHFWRGAYRT